MCEKKPPVQRMNWVSAELTKISVNTYVTTKISYANMLADICDRLPGADVDVVTKALGADTRIGASTSRARWAMAALLPARQRRLRRPRPQARRPRRRGRGDRPHQQPTRSTADEPGLQVRQGGHAHRRCSASPTSRRRRWSRKATASSSRPSSPTRATSSRCTIRWRQDAASACWATRWSAPPRSRRRCASATC
jgi:hypothetical protein